MSTNPPGSYPAGFSLGDLFVRSKIRIAGFQKQKSSPPRHGEGERHFALNRSLLQGACARKLNTRYA